MKRKAGQTEWFIRQIAEGDSVLDETSIDRLSGQLGIRFRRCGYFCVAARYADGGEMTSDAHLPLSLRSACAAAGKNLDSDFYCYIGARLWVIMVLSDDGGDRAALAEKLHQSLERHCERPVQLGVGRSYRQIGKLSYSRVEAYEALGSIGEGGKLSFIDDIYVMRSLTTRKLESEKRKVVELFKAGQLEQMMINVAALAENVRNESPVREGMPYPTSIRRTIVELLFEIMHISADAGVDVDALLDYQDPYTRVFALQNTPMILAWFSEVAAAMHRSIAELSSRRENNMLSRARQCIEENLANPELSLSLVSEALGITPAYFSAFFIRELGVGFNEYITNLRIEKAKQLLSATTSKINAIAAECGFRSASYFIVVFRKQTGVSPGEYRNRKM